MHCSAQSAQCTGSPCTASAQCTPVDTTGADCSAQCSPVHSLPCALQCTVHGLRP